MFLSPWIRQFRSRLSRTSRSRHVRRTEPLEQRTLLSVNAVLIGTDLSVFVDEGDDVTVQNDAASGNVQVLVNGTTDTSIPSIQSNVLTSLSIFASNDDNVINVSAVAAANFTSLPATGGIVIDAGDGDDQLIGSPDFGDILRGQDGDDTIDGSMGDDTLDGGDGADVITGGDGNDSIDAGDGTDDVDGGVGDDVINGGNGNDTIQGNVGMDVIDSGQGNDVVDGGDDNDTINTMSGNDTVNGGAGDDNILAGAGNDSVSGDDGNDVIDGQGGHDTLNGLDGNDDIRGGANHDVINGGLGDDTLNGQSGRDTLLGDAGNDTLLGGGGSDTIFGGDGDDFARGNGGDDSILGGGGSDTLNGDSGSDYVSSFLSGETNIVSTATVNLADVAILEADGGPTVADFVITLTSVQNGVVNIDFTTQDGTATAGADYLMTAGSLVFQPGQMQMTVSVPILDDLAMEADETFTLVLTSPVSALLGRTQAIATILDDESRPITQPVLPGPVTLPAADPATTGEDKVEEPRDPVISLVRVAPDNFDPMDPDGIDVDISPFQFGGNRWTTTATGGGLGQGDPTILTWGILPDGVNIPSFGAGAAANSDLIARLDAIYSETAAGPDVTNRTWFAIVQSMFDRIAEVSGLSYVFEPMDSGGAFPGTNGTLGVDPDIRIGGRDIDGNSGILAFNFLGPPGDMVIDTNDNFFTNLANNSLGLRNVLAHEHLHGLGYNHVNPVNQTKLMEPFVSFAYDGPQFDDILGVQRQYGDVYETGMSNDTPMTATPLGPIAFGSSTTIGLDGVDTPVAPTEVDFVSIDGTSDVDVFSFMVAAGATLDVTLAPVGPTYQQGPQTGPPPTTFDASAQGDLAFEVLDTDGMTVLATVDATVVGGTELVTNLALSNNGTYFVRVTGNVDAVQMYTLTLNVPTPSQPPPGPPAVPDDVIGDFLMGGGGRDTIVGSNSNDTINGSDGNDSVTALGGDDLISTGNGDDTIDAGGGDDTINGGGGDDVINTGPGDDVIVWNGSGNGNDTILESQGAQTVSIMGSSAVNTFTVDSVEIDDVQLLRVSEGNSSITGSASVNEVMIGGGGGDDVITVGSLVGVRATLLDIDGQAGDDTISALNASYGAVRVRLNGGDGNDNITGGNDRDSINGDLGDDLLSGGGGNDVMDGGLGFDTMNGGDGDDSMSGGLDDDTLNGDDGNDSLSGGFGNDVLMGNNGNDSLRGGFGNDNLNGATGNDVLRGDADNDTLAGGSGNDSLSGGNGNDTIKGQSGDDQIKGGDGDDRIEGNSGADTIDGGDGNDTVLGGNGGDIIAGGDGDDSINAMSGRDTIIGGDGNDALIGGGSVDFIYGGDGADTLRGNSGTDRFNSGQGGEAPKDLAPGETDNQNLLIGDSVAAALAALSGF